MKSSIIISVLIWHQGISFLLPQSSFCVTPPLECPNKNITFWLYTRKTQENPHELSISDPESFKQANFTPNAPVKILIHGFTGHRDFDPNIDSRPAYFQRGEYNIISLDYGPIVKYPCYNNAAQNVPLVGRCIAQMIDELVKVNGIPLQSIHVIGMSLGAHVAGAISQWLKSGQLERITGLDPALPLFTTLDPKGKLDKTDAKFVDVIHTNSLKMGKLEPSGHVDFYPNGGLTQAGCEQLKNMSVDGCSHWRTALYFAESINTTVGFYAKKCESWLQYTFGRCDLNRYPEEVIMGEFTPNTARGMYFLTTNTQAPFSKGHWTTGKNIESVSGDLVLPYESIDLHSVESASQNIMEDGSKYGSLLATVINTGGGAH